MEVKPRNHARVRLLNPVIKSIKDLQDPKGSHIRTIVKRVRDSIDNSNVKTKPRNVAMSVKDALKHGVELGLLKYFGGRYKLSNNDKDKKPKTLRDIRDNFCHCCKKKISSLTSLTSLKEEEQRSRSRSSVSEDEDSDVAVYSKRGCPSRCGRRRRRSKCSKKRKRRRRSSCGKKKRRRRSCGKRRRRRSKCRKRKRRKSKCGRRKRRKSSCGRKKKKNTCRRKRRKSKVCLRLNEKDVVDNERGDRNQDVMVTDQEMDQEFKSNKILNARQTKSPSNMRRAQNDENSVEDLQQYDPSGQCRNPECTCTNERRSRSRRSSKHSRLERNNENSKKDVYFLYENESKDT